MQGGLLLDEPKYCPLSRFRDAWQGTLASPGFIKQTLENELGRHQEMLGTLSAGNAASRRMVNEWVDANARAAGNFY